MSLFPDVSNVVYHQKQWSFPQLILWDSNIQTDHVIQACRPDIVVKDKDIDHTWIFDIAVPRDARVDEKQKEKIQTYQDLARELRRLWVTSVNVMIVAALGTVVNIGEYLRMLEIEEKEVERVQFSALLGSATILRKVLHVLG